jgi:hypothetical protein
MSKNASESYQDGSRTVGDLITELCRWPDHATIKFKCPGSSAELCFSRIEGLARGVVEIELQAAPEAAPA